jgi:hypothetical protein
MDFFFFLAILGFELMLARQALYYFRHTLSYGIVQGLEKEILKSGVMVHTYNPSTWEAEAEGS